jgi:hypothetical protein
MVLVDALLFQLVVLKTVDVDSRREQAFELSSKSGGTAPVHLDLPDTTSVIGIIIPVASSAL